MLLASYVSKNELATSIESEAVWSGIRENCLCYAATSRWHCWLYFWNLFNFFALFPNYLSN